MSNKLFFLILFLSLSYQIFGQAPVDTLDLSEVVITQTKSPLPLRKTAKAVQVITRETLEQNSGKDLSQVLNEQVGILVNGAFSNPGKDKNLYLRGAGNDNTLLLIDGQPLTDPSGVGGAFDLRLLDLNQIERIEILKGSQSTLYGSDAIGGVINFITRKNIDRPTAFSGNLAYGSLNTFRGNLGLNGKQKNIDYQVNMGTTRTDGISEAKSNDPTTEFEKDGFRSFHSQAKIGLQLNEQLYLKPFIRYNAYDGDFDADAFTDAANTYQSEVLNTGFNAQWTAANRTIYANYNYTSTDRTFNTSFGENFFQGRFHHADLWINQEIGSKSQLIAGANLQNIQILDKAATEVNPSEQIYSPYLTYLFNTNGWNIEGGLRYNYHTAFGSNLNYSLAAAYWLKENWKVYSNITTGFKAPLLSQLYGAFGANPNLKPQLSSSFELGLQYGLPGDKWNAQLTFFNRKIKDVIAYTFTNGYFNQDEQNDQGVELEITWQANEQWKVSGQYAYLDGNITTPNGTGQDTTFNNLLRRPKHRFALQTQFQPIEAFLISAQFQYLNERNDLFFNPANFFAAEPVVLESYYLVNIYAEYRLLAKRLTIFADIKNLTDQSFSEVYGYNGLGFNTLMGVRFSF